jgi:hypothetical protein
MESGNKLEKGGTSSCTILLCVYIHLFLIRTSLSFFFLDVTEKVFSPYYFFVHRRDELSVRQIICFWRFISNLHFI